MRKLYLDLGNTYIVGDEIENRCYVKNLHGNYDTGETESKKCTIGLRYNNNKNQQNSES